MAIAQVGTFTASGTGTAVSATHGLTISLGDVVVISLGSNGGGPVTQTDNNTGFNFTNTWLKSHPDASSTWGIWTWIGDGSEPLAYAWTLGSSQQWDVIGRVFSGVDSGIWDVTPSDTTWTHEGDVDTTGTTADITIVTAGAMGMILGHCDTDGLTWSNPTNSYINLVTNTVRPSSGWATRAGLSAGAVGTAAMTIDATSDNMTQHCALKPAAAAGRTSKNTHPWPLGVNLGMGIGMPVGSMKPSQAPAPLWARRNHIYVPARYAA